MRRLDATVRAALCTTAVLVAWAGVSGCGAEDAGSSTEDAAAQLDGQPGDGAASGGTDAAGTGETQSSANDDASATDAGIASDAGSAANPPTPLPYPLGTCPTFAAGPNEITAGGALRKFQLFLPAQPKGAPLIFLWHGLGDFATNFATGMAAAQIAQTRGAILAVPQAAAPQSGATAIWQFPSPLATKPPAFDLLLFDALVTCLDQQYDFDNRRVSTMGFSAGALWSTHLVMHRSDWLASAAIFSGGVSDAVVPYSPPTRKVPVAGSHGGPQDVFQGFIKFMEMMVSFSGKLRAAGHTFILCDHGQGHTVTGPLVMASYDFVLAHQWGISGTPYDEAMVKKTFPAYCALN